VKRAALEHFYSFFYFCDRKDEIRSKRLIRDQVKFRPEILAAADCIVAALGSYNAMHVRRGDFIEQFPESNLDAREILKNVIQHVPTKTKLYIATDERDRRFFSHFRKQYELCFLDDFRSLIPEDMPSTSVACVEQVICAAASVFVGTRLSTFSGYITRLRGYYGAADQQIYFTDGSPGSAMDREGSAAFSWINWLNCGNPLWGREYREGWEF
jgi:hypothetical protein